MSPPRSYLTQSQCRAISEECNFRSDSLEGSPSSISLNAFTLSSNENDVECDILQDDNSGYDAFSKELFSPCYTSHFPLPKDLVEFVNSYAFSDKAQTSFNDVFYDADPSIALSPPPVLPESVITPLPLQQCKQSKPSRMHHAADSDRQSKKRKLNRDAAFRYRQKVKMKNEKVRSNLNAAVQDYTAARREYESARDAFDALKRVVIDMVAISHSCRTSPSS